MASNTHKYVAKEGSRNFFCRRAPHGARGLKRLILEGDSAWIESRPAWGAWIETENDRYTVGLDASRPAWGAWIETF